MGFEKNVRDRIAKVFASKGISEIDIAVMPDIVEDIWTIVEEVASDEYDRGYTAGQIAERDVYYG